ncbi:MAG: ADP-ribosylglycohydrolase family protein [Phycisphaerales bacterium]
MPATTLAISVILLAALAPAGLAPAQPLIQRDDYADRLEAMWLAECIANWTGRLTEGSRREPPFLTDADWGSPLTNGRTLTFVLDEDPWPADDDTDIEYVYIEELAQLGLDALEPDAIRDAWVDHINRFIWVANEEARELMDRGVVPPATGMPAANPFYLRIDAQLTTEMFGALAPGLPHAALELADVPIATTAASHAAHAARFHVVLYALAPVADRAVAPEQRVRWLVETARAYLPDTSKAADIVDTVYADYLANPDPTDWERTRDLVYDRYQLNAAANGFAYYGWTESSVNFAGGLIALLYGRGNLPDTIRIGTLTGWDSDNGTATMGGLVGLLLGTDTLRTQIDAVAPGATLSDRYWSSRTRDNMIDHLPDDPDAEDTFPRIAQRMLPVVDLVMQQAGARTGDLGWLLPPGPAPDPTTASPAARRFIASANNAVPRAGGTVTAASSAVAPIRTMPNSATTPLRFINGLEHDDSGVEPAATARQFYASRGAANIAPGDTITLEATYSIPVLAERVRLIEGEHDAFGGWIDNPVFQVRLGTTWTTPAGTLTGSPDPAVPFQIIDFVLDQPATITGVRVSGLAGGSLAYATIAELDAIGPTDRPAWPGFDHLDRNADGRIDIDDLHTLTQNPADIDLDGDTDADDIALLETYIRIDDQGRRAD